MTPDQSKRQNKESKLVRFLKQLFCPHHEWKEGNYLIPHRKAGKPCVWCVECDKKRDTYK